MTKDQHRELRIRLNVYCMLACRGRVQLPFVEREPTTIVLHIMVQRTDSLLLTV